MYFFTSWLSGLRTAALLAALACLLTIDSSYAFQIKNGNVFKVMQTGNPGKSASFVVNSNLRIEGNGKTEEENAGALDLAAIAAAEEAARLAALNTGNGAKINRVLQVCDLETDTCNNVFPSGTDTAYDNYKACEATPTSDPLNCALAWAEEKDLLLYDEYIALKSEEEATEEPLLAEVPEAVTPEEEPLKASAPEVPSIVEALAPMVSAQVIEPVVETPTVELPPAPVPRVSVPLAPAPKRTEFTLDLKTGEPVFPSYEYHAAASEDLLPREFDATATREYYSCVSVPGFMIYSDLWKWLAYRLLLILWLLVLIVFLLAVLVFCLLRRLHDKDGEISKKNNSLFRQLKHHLNRLFRF